MTRLDTHLESEGAEFLVLGQLLIEVIPSYKMYSKQSGYDLIAVWSETDRSARIQVKSRWATDAPHFLISRFDCDFVVLVRLNRGNRYSKKSSSGPSIGDPEYYVLEAREAEAMATSGAWRKLKWKPEVLSIHRRRWDLIRNFLMQDGAAAVYDSRPTLSTIVAGEHQ